jgi:hypothetical protein
MEDEDPIPPPVGVAALGLHNGSNDPGAPNGPVAAAAVVIITPATKTYIENEFLSNIYKIQYILTSPRKSLTSGDKIFAFNHLICLMYALLQVCGKSNSYNLYDEIIHTNFSNPHYSDKDGMRRILHSTNLTGDMRGKYYTLYNLLIDDIWRTPITNKKINQINAAMTAAALNTSPIINLAKQDILERRVPMTSLAGINALREKAEIVTEGGSHKKRRTYKKKNNTKKRTQHSRTRKNRRSLR